MIARLVFRTLIARPARSAVLACGFGFGIAVMATLLGVGEVVLEQARSPGLRGGGDALLTGAVGPLRNARVLLDGLRTTPELKAEIRAASPARRATLWLRRGDRLVPVQARGGIPSLERAVGDPETGPVAAWQDGAQDRTWTAPTLGELLRALDRFHPVPALAPWAAAWAGSWSEWLYFNGTSRDGETRFYLSFLVGPPGTAAGERPAGVRLQLERGGRMAAYSRGARIDEATLLAGAPDLAVAGSSVGLDDTGYVVRLDLDAQDGASPGLAGELRLEARRGGWLRPVVLRGAGGWVSGYVVPVLAGSLAGELRVAGETIRLEGGTGYHDHNWGFWRDVSWQWGQVSSGDLAIVYGRVRPPAEAVDPERVPAFLGVRTGGGVLHAALDVTIEERGAGPDPRPQSIAVRARGPEVDLRLDLEVAEVARTSLGGGAWRPDGKADFLQLRGRWEVAGRVAGREVRFTAPGSAETFRD